MTVVKLKKNERGYEFPIFNGELQSWVLNLTWEDEKAGFPKLRFMVQAFKQYRPQELERERVQLLKSSFDRMFGHNAKKVLDIIEQETK